VGCGAFLGVIGRRDVADVANEKAGNVSRPRFVYDFTYAFIYDAALGIDFWGGDAEVVEALVCKTGLSGFESRRYLQNKSRNVSSNLPRLTTTFPGQCSICYPDEPLIALLSACPAKSF
jgi:hypothetical protein